NHAAQDVFQLLTRVVSKIANFTWQFSPTLSCSKTFCNPPKHVVLEICLLTTATCFFFFSLHQRMDDSRRWEAGRETSSSRSGKLSKEGRSWRILKVEAWWIQMARPTRLRG
uniref:Uncharacterized protein n=1 Tax=Mustela putorius furo TaxID=9669 RepID=M3Z1J8_MUSPF